MSVKIMRPTANGIYYHPLHLAAEITSPHPLHIPTDCFGYLEFTP